MSETIFLKCKNNNVSGTIAFPASKSISNRTLIIQALCDKKFKIENLSLSDDTQILQSLLKSTDELLNAGEGGTTFRFLLAYLALKGKPLTITGSERLLQRPVQPMIDSLNNLGAKIEWIELDGSAALKIKESKLMCGEFEIEASTSSTLGRKDA